VNATDEDDLRLLLHSPALTLQPTPGLADTVRARARRVTRRRRLTGAVASVALVAGGLAFGPAVADGIDGLRTREADSSPGFARDSRFPDATSDVVVMKTLRGAQLLTWYEGSEWCTVTTRVTQARTCVKPIDPNATGIPRYLGAGSPSLTVDDREVIAGVVGSGVSRVKVHLVDGRVYEGDIVEGRGFVRPVWCAVVEGPSSPVAYIAGYDQLGREVTRVGD
jgi:hypothetical protein